MTILMDMEGLIKKYRIGKEIITALDNISLQVFEGEFLCILGTSGSGKTTLLHIMSGLEKPTRGKIVVKGTSLHKLKEKDMTSFRRNHMGFIFQSYNLIPTLTAVENVSLSLMFAGIPRKTRDKRAMTMLKQLGLEHRLLNKPTEMSGGQQQRVSIARALIHNPKIIFADEPTGNLDSKTTMEIMDILTEKVRDAGATLIMVTHDQNISKYADRVIHMLDGSITKIEERKKEC